MSGKLSLPPTWTLLNFEDVKTLNWIWHINLSLKKLKSLSNDNYLKSKIKHWNKSVLWVGVLLIIIIIYKKTPPTYHIYIKHKYNFKTKIFVSWRLKMDTKFW